MPGLELGLDSGNGLIAFTLAGHEDTAGLAALLAERGRARPLHPAHAVDARVDRRLDDA